MKARILIFAGLWLTIAGVIFSAPGCYGRNCEGGEVVYGVDAGQGEMVSDTQWESSPTDGDWLPFPRQRAYSFEIQAFGGRIPFSQQVFLSANSSPNKPGGNIGNETTGAGNIALLNNIGRNHIDVINDTCSDYFLRLVVTLPPLPPTPEPTPPVASASP